MASRDEVLRMARLARIQLEDKEVDELCARFDEILKRFDEITEAPTEGVEARYHALDRMRLRQDRAEAGLSTDSLEQNAPEFFEGHFQIPKVLSSSDS